MASLITALLRSGFLIALVLLLGLGLFWHRVRFKRRGVFRFLDQDRGLFMGKLLLILKLTAWTTFSVKR